VSDSFSAFINFFIFKAVFPKFFKDGTKAILLEKSGCLVYNVFEI